jgi:hypothetical protein
MIIKISIMDIIQRVRNAIEILVRVKIDRAWARLMLLQELQALVLQVTIVLLPLHLLMSIPLNHHVALRLTTLQ